MLERPTAPHVRVGPFEVDLRSGDLSKDGRKQTLPEQPLALLKALIQRPGEVVTRDELRAQLWPADTFVDFEHGLNAAVKRLRAALGDSADSPVFVETVPRRGYRLIARVHDQSSSTQQSQPPPGAAAPGQHGHQKELPGLPFQERLKQRLATRHVGSGLAAAIALLGIIGATVWWAPRLYISRPSARGVMTTTPLTSLPGQERHPSFSPDGNQIAFAWDGASGDNQDIYVKVIGAEIPLRLTSNSAADRTPAWSPDGRLIAFVRSSDEESGIFVIPALGGPDRRVGSLTSPHEWPAGPSWSPDGKLLVLHDRMAPSAPLSIFVFSIENLEKRKLTSPPPDAVGDIAPAISPDGRNVAFNRIGVAGGIYVVPLGGGEPKRITPEQDWRVERLAWSPDGHDLVFSSSGGSAESSATLWRVSASGGTPERLTVGGDNAANPAVSRRGNRLAFEQRRQDANIWRIPLPTSTRSTQSAAKLIASTRHESGPQFSPDGARIAFQSDRSGTFEIWTCDSAGSDFVQLTSFGGPVVGSPRWSPEGRRIAFEVLAKGHSDIYLINVEGGLPRRITSETSDDVVPSWSRDGRWIYFASNRTQRHEVWKVPAAGGVAIQVTKKGGFTPFESSDGAFLYFSRGFDVDGLWRVAVNGGDEEQVLNVPKAGLWGYWAVVEKGIYFVNTESTARPAVQFLSFATRTVVRVAMLDGKPVAYEPGIAVSADGRWLLYTQEDERTSDIMLVENFR